MEAGAGEPEGRDPLMRRSNSGGSTLLEVDIARVDLDHAVRSGVRQAFICRRTGEYRQPLRSHHTHGGSSLQIWGIICWLMMIVNMRALSRPGETLLDCCEEPHRLSPKGCKVASEHVIKA
jgi:hypothetical protein